MEKDAEEHLRRAIELARASVAEGGGPFGAVVAAGDRVLGEGSNRVVLSGDPTAHAEVVAIRAAARALGTHDLSGAVLYASCEPCPMCLGAALWARLERVLFASTRADAARAGFDDAAFHEEATRPTGEFLPRDRVDVDGANAPFDDWLALPDRVPY